MLRISKKDALFFDYFLKIIDIASQSSAKLEDLIENYTNQDVKTKQIAELEHSCDILVHEAMRNLNAAFITPIDREDIVLILKKLDDIVDNIEEAAFRFILFNVKTIEPRSIELSKLISTCIANLKLLIEGMATLKPNKGMLTAIIEVNRLENQADILYREELTKLFSNTSDPIHIIKWQGIYNYLERAVDACEDVANIIEGVVMKHA